MVLAETRTTEGTTKVLGGPMSAAVLYLKRDFMEKNPNTVQALVNAFYKTLQWLDKATPEQITDNVPAGILAGRQGALHRRREEQPAGLLPRRHRQRRRARSARSISCKQFDKEIAAATIDTGQDLGRPLREEGRRDRSSSEMGSDPIRNECQKDSPLFGV